MEEGRECESRRVLVGGVGEGNGEERGGGGREEEGGGV